jgi:hypothetical protein
LPAAAPAAQAGWTAQAEIDDRARVRPGNRVLHFDAPCAGRHLERLFEQPFVVGAGERTRKALLDWPRWLDVDVAPAKRRAEYHRDGDEDEREFYTPGPAHL